MRTRPLGTALVLGLSLCAARTSAQDLGAFTGTGNNLNIEHFEPHPLGLGTLDRSRAQTWREWSVGIYVHYARNPLVLFADRLQVGEVVAHRLSADVVGTVGLLSWLELQLAVPVSFYQTGDTELPTGALAKIGLRDLRAAAKITVATQDRTGFLGIALVPEISIPTGDASAFLGDGNFTFSPHLLLDRSFDVLFGLRAGVAAGLRIRPRAEIGNIEIDDEVFYRAGVGVGLPGFLGASPEALAEVTGTSRLDNLFAAREQNAVIGRVGLRMAYDTSPGYRTILTGGFGVGTTRGYGSPDFHVYTGLVFQRYLADRDGDGIVDDDDLCPDDPEDFDGFEDSDGCPDPDNDRDGIPDVADKCPDEPEDFDGFEDLDGCPDPDNDGDGIPDVRDACPDEPEDFDGFEDEDGCPDPDNDRDGIPDDQDKCPNEKETINGIDDEDGCPDEGEAHVEVTAEKVTIDTRIEFDYDSASIRPESFSILSQVALTLRANPQLQRIRVEGHTDDRGSDLYNLDLSQRRAESVMRYLIQRGVDPRRLEARGYGKREPLMPGSSDKARAKNRRVEFTILAQGEVETRGRSIEIPVD